MKKAKLFTKILAALTFATSLTACLDDSDGPYSAGFIFESPVSVRTYIYANTTTDSLIMQCLGPWQITSDTPQATWCTIEQMKGYGSSIYDLVVRFSQNTTGQPRLAQFTITDTEHPDKAHNSWQYLQYATRGDGSFGTAALVKEIKSSDDWTVSISYDEKCRPVQVTVKNPDGNSDSYSMRYNETEKRLTVTSGSSSLTGTMDNGYQTERLLGAGDTIGYVAQYYSNGVQMPASYAFNYLSARLRRTQAFAYLLGGKNLTPDSLHTADSLIYYCRWKVEDKPTTTERYKLEYGQMDNRYQSVDANQLLLGMADCEPLQLLSMFRYTRSTSIVTKATSKEGTIDVSTELNADRSVRRMVVKDACHHTETTYDFTY